LEESWCQKQKPKKGRKIKESKEPCAYFKDDFGCLGLTKDAVKFVEKHLLEDRVCGKESVGGQKVFEESRICVSSKE